MNQLIIKFIRKGNIQKINWSHLKIFVSIMKYQIQGISKIVLMH